jgi:hypothetical protein
MKRSPHRWSNSLFCCSDPQKPQRMNGDGAGGTQRYSNVDWIEFNEANREAYMEFCELNELGTMTVHEQLISS